MKWTIDRCWKKIIFHWVLKFHFTSTWLPNQTFMEPSDCSVFSPSEVFIVSVGNICLNDLFQFKEESKNMRANKKTKRTRQATWMEFNEELCFRFCRQDGQTVHDLYSALRCFVWIWKWTKKTSDNSFEATYVCLTPTGDLTVLWDKLRSDSNFKRGENWRVVTCHDVISATCEGNSLAKWEFYCQKRN